MSVVIYMRVSTKDQEFLRQEHLFSEKGIHPDKVFEEKISGKDTQRPQLKEMMNWLREGDTVYIESISRLARNTKDFLEIVEKLERKGIKLISLKEDINTSTPTGRFLLSVFASLAQLERETILTRQKESLDARKEQGLPIGRPQIKMSKTFPSNYKIWKAGHITAVKFMELEKLKKNTFYKLVKDYEATLISNDSTE